MQIFKGTFLSRGYKVIEAFTLTKKYFLMNEDFLFYLWKFRLLVQGIKTTEGENIEIIQPGTLNQDAGPDFFDARIRIGNTLWAGNIEMHVNSSDWKKHGHQHDERYQNIILHVVYNDDEPVMLKNGQAIPTLIIKDAFNDDLFDKYRRYMKGKSWVACEKNFPVMATSDIQPWIDSLIHERLTAKVASIERALILQCFNWEQTLYQFLASNFGFKLNSHAFELLARSLPIQIINEHRHNLFELEALLFGQAGFLYQEYDDEYFHKLRNEYLLYRKRYLLRPIDVHLWNFLRLRPSNFPTIRLAQFAYLLGQSGNLFDLFIKSRKINKLYKHLMTGTSAYWHTHYNFDKPSAKSRKQIGKESIQLIIINTIVPFNYVYGLIKDKPAYTRKAIAYLKALPPERNHVILKWKSIGADIPSAFESQAYLQLKKIRCEHKQCLECKIGEQVMKDIRV